MPSSGGVCVRCDTPVAARPPAAKGGLPTATTGAVDSLMAPPVVVACMTGTEAEAGGSAAWGCGRGVLAAGMDEGGGLVGVVEGRPEVAAGVVDLGCWDPDVDA